MLYLNCNVKPHGSVLNSLLFVSLWFPCPPERTNMSFMSAGKKMGVQKARVNLLTHIFEEKYLFHLMSHIWLKK